MTGEDFLSTLKAQVREELNEKADEIIETLVDKLRYELEKHKNSLIAGMLDGIDLLVNTDEINNKTIFQINIKTGRSDTK